MSGATAQTSEGRETEGAFAARFQRPAKIESMLSQGVQAMHLRRARYIGLVRMHLPDVLTTAAINLARFAACAAGEPRARTRQPSFVRLVAQLAQPLPTSLQRRSRGNRTALAVVPYRRRSRLYWLGLTPTTLRNAVANCPGSS